ncbi:MAG: FixH family protein [Rhodoferax sp.]|nr:FixH family protein [Rhodoferax sp.]
MPSIAKNSSSPWWKHGHVWLVLSGPVVVVIASFFTFYLAYIGMDTLVDEDYYRKGVELNQTADSVPTNLAPAMQARNHAATGLVVKPKP